MSEQDGLRGLVWKSLLDAEYAALYYGYLARRYARLKKVLTGIVVFVSSGAVAAALREEFKPFYGVLSMIAALVSAYLFSNPLEKTAILGALECHRWKQLQLEYELLWQQLPALDEAIVRQRWQELELSSLAANKTAPAEFPLIKRLQARCEQEVVARHGHGSPEASSTIAATATT